MIEFTVINALGEPINIISVPDEEHAVLNTPVGCSRVDGVCPPDSYYRNGAWITKPIRPDEYHTWDTTGKMWVDPRTLIEIKTQRWTDMKVARGVALTAPLTTPFGVFDATVDSQKGITDAVLMLQTLASLGTPTTIDFTLTDNTTVTLTTAQMVQVGLLLGQRTQTIFAQYRLKRIAIEAATTVAEVEAING